jgi:cobalt/nickel transport protein
MNPAGHPFSTKLAMRFVSGLLLLTLSLTCPLEALAHFLVLVPSQDVVEGGDGRTVDLRIEFTHPMEKGPRMDMEHPQAFGVMMRGSRIDLLERLKASRDERGRTAYTASAELTRPSDYVFYVEPTPYWEPAEQKMIVHYSKVVVDYLGAETGWDAMVGTPVEIEPLVRPYGLWTGNAFRGVVHYEGEPVPFAEIEVEYLNGSDGEDALIPNGAFATQVIKADERGVFSYTMPKAGWWGFAALVEGEETMTSPEGNEVSVELGGLMWVRAVDMKTASSDGE